MAFRPPPPMVELDESLSMVFPLPPAMVELLDLGWIILPLQVRQFPRSASFALNCEFFHEFVKGGSTDTQIGCGRTNVAVVLAECLLDHVAFECFTSLFECGGSVRTSSIRVGERCGREFEVF